MKHKIPLTLLLAVLLFDLMVVTCPDTDALKNGGIHLDITTLSVEGEPDIRSRFAGGNGTAENPYRIANVTQLQDMNLDLGANYTLVNDIDASETRKWNDGKGFEPISNYTGIEEYLFTGSLDGRGHIISSLYINRSDEDNIALFGYVKEKGHISNITMVNIDVTGVDNVGSIVGANRGTVENCSTNGYISGFYDVGGLIGWSDGPVQNCHSEGDVLGLDRTGKYIAGAGGLIGGNDGVISNCYATADVDGYWCVGGFVGVNRYGMIEKCTSEGDSAGYNKEVGGFAGLNRGILQNCSATGTVQGIEYIGGFCGINYNTIRNCSASGVVNGDEYVGGLVGLNDDYFFVLDTHTIGSITNCYATADVNGGWCVGGLVGDGFDHITNSFYCINAPTINGKNVVTPYGIYKEQFDQWVSNGKELDINDYLFRITGTDYYGIADISDIKNMLPFAAYGTNKFRQTRDIDMSTVSNIYVYILNAGEFDGSGYFIDHLNISADFLSMTGLFGYLGSQAKLTNVSLNNIDVYGDRKTGGLVGVNDGGILHNCSVSGTIVGTYKTGGLVGKNAGTVRDCGAAVNVYGEREVGGLIGCNLHGSVEYCFSTGRVFGNDSYIGGLVGSNKDTIQKCYATGRVSGGPSDISEFLKENRDITLPPKISDYTFDRGYIIGGLVGQNDGIIVDCYATGDVIGYFMIGGLVGYNSDTVKKCYSTGTGRGEWKIDSGGLVNENKGFVKSCFWDTVTSNQSYSGGGKGIPTREMKREKTFAEAGWDFNTTWKIDECLTYPYLQWEGREKISGYDSDNDSIPDQYNPFPLDPAAFLDSDGDGSPDEWNPGMHVMYSTTGLHLDALPYDPAASLDSDNDGSPDGWNPGMNATNSITGLHLDAFPLDPAASIDTDHDGMPDEWNPGMDERDSTSVPPLKLDQHPNDPGNIEPVDDYVNRWIVISLGVAFLVFIAIVLIVSVAVKRRLPRKEESRLSEKTLKAMKEGKKQLESGKGKTLEEVEKELND